MMNSAISLYKIPREMLNEMLAEDNLDVFEEYIRLVEEGIFDGPFTAQKIEDNLRLVVFSEELNTMQSTNMEILHNNPFREAVVGVFKELGMQNLADKIETGQQSRPEAVSLSEKKTFYNEVFDEMGATITAIKERLKTMQGKTPRNNHIISLLERYEKCDEEIRKICGIVRNF